MDAAKQTTADVAAAPSGVHDARAARGGRRRPWPLAVVAASFAAGVALGGHRLGDLFIDCGRELEVPRRLLGGDLLYRDVRYYWGPLAPYLNAAIYAVFGVSIDALRWAGIASAVVGTAGVYLLARRFLGRWASALVACTFVHVCAFAQIGTDVAIFNFVLPFNFSATYGIVLAIWSLVLLLGHAATGRRALLLGSAILLGLAALTKVEVALAAAAGHAAYAIASRRALGKAHAAAYSAAALIVAGAFGSLWTRVGPALWRDNLSALGNEASRYYVVQTMGLANPRAAAMGMAASLVALGALLGVAVATARAVSARRAPAPIRSVAAAGLAAAGFAVPFVAPLQLTLRALPVAMVAAVAALAWGRRRHGERFLGGRWRADLVLWVAGLASLARIPLAVMPAHYGFFLLPVGLVCLAVLFLDYAPRLAGDPSRRIASAGGVGLLAGLVVAAVRLSWPNLAAATVELVAPRGTLTVPADVPEPELIRLLSGMQNVRSAIAVPQGAGVLFASGLPSGADGMTSYLPMEIPDDAADERLVARWQAAPPDVVLYWNQDLATDFGSAGFGVGYAVRARRWLTEHYVPITDPSFPTFVLVRRP